MIGEAPEKDQNGGPIAADDSRGRSMDENVLITVEDNGLRLTIYYDTDAPTPMNWSCLGTIVGHHERYPRLVDVDVPDLVEWAEKPEEARAILASELEVYSAWLNGEVYGYKIETMAACPCCGAPVAKELESCWNRYSLDDMRGVSSYSRLFDLAKAKGCLI